MKRALVIVSVATLLVIGVAVVGRALIETQGITYGPNGLPVTPSPLATVAIVVDGIQFLAIPLCLATGVLGLIVAATRSEYGWLVALVVAGMLALVGLVGMAWVLLSANSPIAFVTPLAVVPLVALFYAVSMART
jgi:hypothetical protein